MSESPRTVLANFRINELYYSDIILKPSSRQRLDRLPVELNFWDDKYEYHEFTAYRPEIDIIPECRSSSILKMEVDYNALKFNLSEFTKILEKMK